jgi:ABC-type spermidine/putrescine transport system permease subunit II
MFAAVQIMAYLTFVYLIVPTFVIIPVSLSSERYLTFPPAGYSLQWYSKLVNTPGYALSFANTLKVGLLVTIFSMAIGTLAALAIVRGKPRFARGFSALVLSPLMLPQIILVIGLYPVLAATNLIGGYAGIVIAHTVVASPLVFITVSASLRNYSPSLELAAMTMGANPLQTFRLVTLPMIRAGVMVGGLFAFASSFDEVVMALFLTDTTSITLPKFMLGELQYEMDPTIAAASTLIVFISLFTLSIVALLQNNPRTTKKIKG